MKQQRSTKQRQLILDTVKARHDHPSADQIYLDVRTEDDKISRGTVYRNLNILVEQGELLQVELPQTNRFEAQLTKHYHLVCKECGAVSDAPLPYQSSLDEEITAKLGYAIDQHQIVFHYICPACQEKQP